MKKAIDEAKKLPTSGVAPDRGFGGGAIKSIQKWNGFELDALMKETEAGNFLGASKRTLQKWRVTGGGPKFVRCGSSVRYRIRDLIEYIDQNTVSSTSEAVAS